MSALFFVAVPAGFLAVEPFGFGKGYFFDFAAALLQTTTLGMRMIRISVVARANNLLLFEKSIFFYL
jgi:hypothetical protein